MIENRERFGPQLGDLKVLHGLVHMEDQRVDMPDDLVEICLLKLGGDVGDGVDDLAECARSGRNKQVLGPQGQAGDLIDV